MKNKDITTAEGFKFYKTNNLKLKFKRELKKGFSIDGEELEDKNKEFEIKLSIRDTKAPELTLKDRIVCGINTPITANECLAEVVDADNNLKATFQDAVLTDENITFEKILC